MVEVLPESQGKILVLRATSRLTDQDYKEVLIPRLEAILREHGKARVLLDLGDKFPGMDAAAVWDDLRLGLGHRHDFEKVGVVGGSHWIRPMLKMAALMMSGEIESFSPSERDRALEWIRA
jgi:hypothetical protein